MDCKLVESLLPNFLDEELTEELAEQVQAHIVRCRRCAWEVESLRQSIAALRDSAAAGQPSAEARERLWTEVLREHRAAMASRRPEYAASRRARVYVLDATEEDSDEQQTSGN